MSDAGNVNGDLVDDPLLNDAVVGVDYQPPTGEPDPPPPEGDAPGSGAYDPGAHTVDAIESYVTANPGEAAAVLAAEQAGKNRTTLVAWLEEFDAG